MRILIISSDCLSKTANNGKTIGSFFDSLDSKCLSQLYFQVSDTIPNMDICKNYYRISEKDIIKSILNFSFRAKNSFSQVIMSKLNDSECTVETKSDGILSFLRKHRSTIAVFRELLWNLGTWDTKELRDWINSIEPDIIFCHLGDNIFTHKICLKISKKYNIPFVAFITDDNVLNDVSTNFIERFHYHQLCKAYKKSIRHAGLVYAIGELMKADYEKFFKREFGVLVNSIDFSLFSKIQEQKLDKDEDIIISYFGGLHLNRWKSIAILGKMIQEINSSCNLKIKIRVFCVQKPNYEILNSFRSVNVEYAGALSQGELIEQISLSHFLLHVESFDKINRKYTHYSISTKIPEYLVSKRRIIAYGPHEIASISLLEQNNFACCLTDLDTKDSIKEKILKAINSYNDFDYSVPHNYSLKKFDKKVLSHNLLSSMSELISKKSNNIK